MSLAIEGRTLKVFDGSDYYLVAEFRDDVTLTTFADMRKAILNGGIEHVAVYAHDGARRLLLFDMTPKHVSVYNGTHVHGPDDYIELSADFGNDALPLTVYIRDLIDAVIDVRDYLAMSVDFVLTFLKESLNHYFVWGDG